MPFLFALPLILLIVLVFVISVLSLVTLGKRVMLKVCLALFIFSSLGSFFFYTASYLSSGAGAAETLQAALRGIFSTVRVFFINDDYGALTESPGTLWLASNIWPQVLFWLCHVTAVIVVQAALIAVFGRKLADKLRLRYGRHREVYIIKGSDKNSLLLGENIAARDDPRRLPDAGRLVVFLLEEDDDEQYVYETVSRFGGVICMLNRDNDFTVCLEKAGMGRRHGRGRKYNVILTPDEMPGLDDVRCVVEYAKEKGIDSGSLEIFVLPASEWDREEIERRAYPYTLHITREMDLITRQIIDKHPPFECPGFNFNDTGAAPHNFTVMILGFGDVGQHAFLRLVMNGQFAGSRMRAVIVDKDMENLRDRFLHRHPALGLCCEMEFYGCDARSETFFELLKEFDHADYIVAALGTDEESKQAALDIRLHYERKAGEALPFIAISEEYGSPEDEELSGNILCFGFGRREDLYKESVIIRKEADVMAKAVNNVYTGNGQPWDELDWFTQESNRAAADSIPAMLKLSGLDEKEAAAKDCLTDDAAAADVLAQTEHLRWMAFHAAMGYRPMSLEEMNRRFENYRGEGDRLAYCRKDPAAKTHICLVSWDELDKVNEWYRELARRANNVKEQSRDFKKNDSDVLQNIPKFLRAKNEAGK